MPRQKPGKSKQTYGTPPEFIRAIERDFHVTRWACDLAADASNKICEMWYGPGSPVGVDSFQADWTLEGDLWLNPPFADIEPWARKCATTRRVGRIFQLSPASIGTNWYAEIAHGRAHVVALAPRLTFVGETDAYPKDLMLLVWGPVKGGSSCWRWK
jgi:DNA (cytosine-5)-methyltransferase 1